jgi:hypothetical protein
MAGDIERLFAEMEKGLAQVLTLSSKIGSSEDRQELREELQNEVRCIQQASNSAKIAYTRLGEGELDPAEKDRLSEWFTTLREKMQQQLPSVIEVLKNVTLEISLESPGHFSYTEPLLNQEELDQDRETLEALDFEITDILANMKQLNQLFQSTLEEIQRQRNLVTAVDEHVAQALDDMFDGNEQLDKAQRYHKRGNRCLCWVFLIVAVVVVCLVLIVCGAAGVFKKK